jgi:hypothetical protein
LELRDSQVLVRRDMEVDERPDTRAISALKLWMWRHSSATWMSFLSMALRSSKSSSWTSRVTKNCPTCECRPLVRECVRNAEERHGRVRQYLVKPLDEGADAGSLLLLALLVPALVEELLGLDALEQVAM